MRLRTHGFTLVEMLVALTLIGVGVAAWVGTTAVALQLAGASRRTTEAELRARSRAELLAGGECGSLVSGASFPESWTVTPLRHGIRLVRVEMRYRDERRMRVAAYEMAAAC